MARTALIAIIISFLCAGTAVAEKAESLAQAKELSGKTGKPILMKFVHED
jgi:hypothetical protein